MFTGDKTQAFFFMEHLDDSVHDARHIPGLKNKKRTSHTIERDDM